MNRSGRLNTCERVQRLGHQGRSATSGLDSGHRLVPFTEMQGTQEEGPLRGAKCQVLLQA